MHHRASRSRITDGFVREGSAAALDKPHVVGTLPTAFSNVMFLVQRVDTPDPVRPLLSSGNGTSKFRCAELRDLVSETKLVHDLVLTDPWQARRSLTRAHGGGGDPASDRPLGNCGASDRPLDAKLGEDSFYNLPPPD